MDNRWSVFREPWNSWSSLFFSFFGNFYIGMVTAEPFSFPWFDCSGLIAIFTGLRDLYQNPDPKFALAAEPGFSVAFGICAVYLGE